MLNKYSIKWYDSVSMKLFELLYQLNWELLFPEAIGVPAEDSPAQDPLGNLDIGN